MMRFFWILLAAMFAGNVCAQSTSTIHGKTITAKGAPVASATIHLLNTNQFAISSDSGLFVMNAVDNGSYTIDVSAVGYASVSGAIKVPADSAMVFVLQPLTVQLDDVFVTAGKREELLLSQALSVTAISSKQAEDYRLWNVKDLAGIVPGLYSGNPGDERNVTSIRGITTTSYDPAITTYVDGVNQFSLDTYIPQLNDIERIEVLRGPQGTLYGRNAMGGVINIITKQPTNNTGGFAEASIGNYNQQRYSAGIRTPFVKNKLFFGASAMYQSRDGYYTNEFNGSSFDKQSGFSGNYYLKYLPAASWVVTANFKHQNNRNDGAFALVYGTEEAFNNPFKLNQNALGTMIDNTMNASLSLQHFGKKANFSSQTTFQNNHRYYDAPIDADFSPADAITIANDYGNEWNNVKVVTEELRFNSPANQASRFSWTAGSYLFYQYNPTKQATHFGKDAPLAGVPDSNFSTINTSKGKNAGFALYGQADYKISAKLSVFAGLRFDYENRDLSVKGEYQPDGIDPIVVTPDTSASNHFTAVSPKAGVQYKFTNNNNVYASYSCGFRTGGLTQLSGDPSQPPLYPYEPEYSDNFEVGIKNMFFENRLRVNAAAFLTYVTNAQVPTLVLPDAIVVTRNTGSLHSRGVELEMSATPLKGLLIDYSGGYTDASYQSLKVASNGQAVDLAGKKQIFTPSVTSMLAAQYSVALGKRTSLQLVARAEYFYYGERYFDLANTIRQSPYNLLNAKAGLSCKHLSLYFWARNLTNIHYIEYGYDFGAVHLGAPKTYGVTLRVNF